MKNDVRLSPAAVIAAARGDLENFMVAATPGGIEMQEAAGQAAFVGTRDVLPIDCPRVQLEQLGFVFGENADDLFVNVTLPAGWSKRATNHSMWSDLLDAKGRNRGGIFYKAAFYDRSAHMSLTTRYCTENQYLDKDDKTTETYPPARMRSVVKDRATGEIVFSGASYTHRDWDADRKAHEEARAWMAEHYPDSGNPLAYWV